MPPTDKSRPFDKAALELFFGHCENTSVDRDSPPCISIQHRLGESTNKIAARFETDHGIDAVEVSEFKGFDLGYLIVADAFGVPTEMLDCVRMCSLAAGECFVLEKEGGKTNYEPRCSERKEMCALKALKSCQGSASETPLVSNAQPTVPPAPQPTTPPAAASTSATAVAGAGGSSGLLGPITNWAVSEQAAFPGGPASPQLADLLSRLAAPADASGQSMNEADLRQLLRNPRASETYADKLMQDASPPLPKHASVAPRQDLAALFTGETFLSSAKTFLQEHAAELQRAQDAHHVQPEDVVAVLLLQSRLGQGEAPGTYRLFNVYMGKLLFLDAAHQLLVSQGHADESERQSKRIARIESHASKTLANLLRACRAKNQDPLAVAGDYAGDIGYPQFSPGSLRWEEDGNGDGIIDLYQWPDAIMSVANYLDANGYGNGRETALRKYNPASEWVAAAVAVSDALHGPGNPVAEAPVPPQVPNADDHAQAVQAYREAYGLMNANDNIGAVAKLQQALQLDPSMADAHKVLGWCYGRLGQFDERASHFEQYLKLRPNAGDAAEIRGVLDGYYRSSAPGGSPGRLAFRVLPWASVFIDGRMVGTTPFGPIDVPAGRHRVELVNDELHAKRSVTVEIKSGETSTIQEKLE